MPVFWSTESICVELSRQLCPFGGFRDGGEVLVAFPPLHPIAYVHSRAFAFRAVLFGGFNGKELLNDVHLLDLSTFVWTCVSIAGVPLPPSHGHCAAQVPGTSTVRARAVCV